MAKGLNNLIGKRIKNIEVAEYDLEGDGTRVDEIYRFTCDDDGEVFYFMCDGGDCEHYGTLNRVNVDKNGKIEGEDYGRYIEDFKSLK